MGAGAWDTQRPTYSGFIGFLCFWHHGPAGSDPELRITRRAVQVRLSGMPEQWKTANEP